MQAHFPHMRTPRIDRPRSLLSTTTVASAVALAVLLFAPIGDGAEPSYADGVLGDVPVVQGDGSVEEDSGPTLTLSYSLETPLASPLPSFMYFVPLISTTLVDRHTSLGNDEVVRFVSYDRKISSRSFHVTCDFEIRGKGFHKNTFDPAGMIAARLDELEKGKPLTHVLAYIRFEGEGLGRIEVKGTVDNATETVTSVDLQFNVQGRRSPVTIGLYDVRPKDGQYQYENRSNELVARVNTLAFRRSDAIPRMGVTLASVTRAAARDGVLARIRGAIANLLIKAPKIDRRGNETMLNFGYAIYEQKREFTFPMARNIREDSVIPTVANGS